MVSWGKSAANGEWQNGMESTAKLIIHVGTDPEREFVLGEGNVLIGRDANNELVVQDSEASRRHSRIVLDTAGYVVEDLGSTNGTYVNGQRVTGSALLQDGDTITLGRAVRLMFMGHAPTLGIDPMNTIQQQQDAGDTAAVFAPPPADYARSQPPPAIAQPDPEPAAVAPAPRPPVKIKQERGCQRYFIYTGCGLLSLFLIAGIALFAVDAVAPDALYCGALQPFWEMLNPLLQLFNRVFDCAVLT